jgi:4-amino-4-deoxy-L-arabinose transferase-like glycosyltransferase
MSKTKDSLVVLGITSIGLIVNLWLLWLYYSPSPKQLVGDENYYYSHASLIASGTRVPYNLIWPPLYGELIGIVFSMFGEARIYVQMMQIGLWLISGFVLSQIVRRLTSSRIAAHTCLALFLLSPDLIAFSHYLWPETVHLFLWLLGLWLLVCHSNRRVAHGIAGVAFGLALLTKSLLMPFIPVVILYALLIHDSALKVRLTNAAVGGCLVLVTILPVMVSNLMTRGEFIIADSSLFNIYVGLNDKGLTDYSPVEIVGPALDVYMGSGPTHKIRNAIYREKVLTQLEQQGVLGTLLNQVPKQYLRLFDIQTYLTTQLPGMARPAYTTKSTGVIWALRSYSYLMYGFVLVAGAAGACFVRIASANWPSLFLLFILYNLGVFLVLHVKTRYVIQFMPFLIFFASVACCWLAASMKRTHEAVALNGFAFGRGRVVCALVIGTTMGITMVQSLL